MIANLAPLCHGSLTGHRRQAAGLRLSAAGIWQGPGELGSARTRSRLPACASDRHLSGEEDGCAVAHQRLLLLDESSPEPPAARCGLNPLLRLDRARSIRTLAAGAWPPVSLPPGSQREENKGGQELEAASGEHDRMTGTISDGSQAGVSGQGRRRARQPVPRTRRVEFTLTGEEYAVLGAGGQAGRAGPASLRRPGGAGRRRERQPTWRPGVAPAGADRADARGRAGPPHRHQPQPGGREAERHRAACRGPARLRRREHPPRRPHRRRLPTPYARPCGDGRGGWRR